MSWLSNATGIHLNLKPLAPVIGGAVGSLVGMPTLGAAAGGMLSHLGEHAPAQPSGGGGFSLPGALGAAGSWLGGNGGKNALGVLQGLNAAQLQNQATQYAKGAYGNTMQSWNQRAPLRAAGIAGMLQPRIPDMSALSTIAGRNPYAVAPTGASPSPLVPVQGAPR